MKPKKVSLLARIKNLLRSKIAIGGLVILIALAVAFFAGRGTTQYQFVTVKKGPIVETVSLTGNTTPTQSVSLAFQNSGTIARIYRSLGERVQAGDLIAQLNTASLAAAVQQAQASVSTQEAKLASLKAGSRPADIAASQSAYEKTKQDLANLYSGIADISTSGYAKANDAVRTQLNTLFSGAETNQPQLTFQTSSSQAAVDVSASRVIASNELNAWQQELLVVNTNSSQEILGTTLKKDLAHLATIQALLIKMSFVLDGNINLSPTQLATAKTNLTTALAAVNATISSFNTVAQNIASQGATVAQAEAQLSLKKSGATVEDIAAQEAQIEEARAAVASARANLSGAQIVAPISGIITIQDAKVGQLATPGVALVSIIGNGGFEVEAGVSETDVGKLAVGNKVTMSIDAFANETFEGTVFYIAPAQTNNQGVISYLVKISFTKPDARIKSGLTANIDIETKRIDDALILPQYAIIQNDDGAFVETVEGKTTKKNPITIGIQDQKGNAQIVSGVVEGESVLNIGLKVK